MKWLGILIVFSFLYSASAAQLHATGTSLSIKPAVVQVDIKEDSPVTIPITIQNGSDNSVRLKSLLVSFTPTAKNDGSITLETHIRPQYQALFGNIAINEKREINLAPYESKTVNIGINTYKNVSKQDYYFTLSFIAQDDALPVQSQSKINAGIGLNIILSYQNISNPSMQVSGFETDFLGFRGPVIFTALASNTGSKVGTTLGTLDITNMFGQTVSRTLLKNTLILAHSFRYLEAKDQAARANNQIVWNERFILGIYKATLTIQNEKRNSTKSIYFIRIPLNYLISLIIISAFAAGVLIKVRKRIKFGK